jgi:hypothetical protein
MSRPALPSHHSGSTAISSDPSRFLRVSSSRHPRLSPCAPSPRPRGTPPSYQDIHPSPISRASVRLRISTPTAVFSHPGLDLRRQPWLIRPSIRACDCLFLATIPCYYPRVYFLGTVARARCVGLANASSPAPQRSPPGSKNGLPCTTRPRSTPIGPRYSDKSGHLPTMGLPEVPWSLAVRHITHGSMASSRACKPIRLLHGTGAALLNEP